MTKIDDLLLILKRNPKNVRFSNLCGICDHYFGEPRQQKNRIYKTPWQGDPRITIQNHKGKAKAYQVKQVLLAVEKLEVSHGHKK